MHYGTIKKTDIANGPGVRVSLFVSGCTHACEGCFNAETWNFTYGQPFIEETEREILNAMRPAHITGLTLLGGEPFEPENQRVLMPFLRKVREAFPEKTVWCYTGYLLDRDLLEVAGVTPAITIRYHEEMNKTVTPYSQKPSKVRARCEVTDEMLSLIDVLVDGEFVLALKDITLKFRGSSNQRIIDLHAASDL